MEPRRRSIPRGGATAPDATAGTASRGRRPRRETIARVAVAIPWIALAIFIVAVGGIPFALAMIGFAVIGLSELFRMTRRYRPLVPVAFAVVAALVIAAYYGSQFQLVLIIAAAFPVMFVFALTRGLATGITHSIGITVLGIAWIGIPFVARGAPSRAAASWRRAGDRRPGRDLRHRHRRLRGGRLFGRHPLAPHAVAEQDDRGPRRSGSSAARWAFGSRASIRTGSPGSTP